MFERFTDRARRAVVLSQEEARGLEHNYIGTEHMLLGLLHEGEGVAAKALTSQGITLESARGQVLELVGRGAAPSSGHIPYTPRAKKVLELALREALQLGHPYIGTEHLLLALLREGEGIGAQILTKLGTDVHQVRAAVLTLLIAAPRVQTPPPSPTQVQALSPTGQTQFNCPACGAVLQARMSGWISREEVEEAIRVNNEVIARAISTQKG